MMRAMMLTSLALAVTASAASANVQGSESDWQATVDSDKQDLSSAMSNMQYVAHEYRKASNNDTRSAEISLNLAETAFKAAHDDAAKDQQNAMSDFNSALDDLKSASATNSHDAERAARQKSDKVSKAYKQERDDAMTRLKVQRAHESHKISDAYDQARHAANKLLKDKTQLEKAMGRNGRREEEYQRVSQDLEQHAERQRDNAEDNRDRASDAVEQIFGDAQDHLFDREQSLHDHKNDERERAIDEAVSQLRGQQIAQASPELSALDLYAKADNSHSRQAEEQDAQHAVDSDKSRLSSSMQHLDRVVNHMHESVKNRTHAEELGAEMAKKAVYKAAHNSMSGKEAALKDFHKYLEDLKSASPQGKWDHELRTVKEQARYLDKLDRKENEEARKEFRRYAENNHAKESYHSAHHAAMDLLRDKNRLERAMRHAGASEREYEDQEKKNEKLGQRFADQSEDLNDELEDASEEMYEHASDNFHALQHANHKQQHAESHYRRKQIHDAVETLKYARRGKTYTVKHANRGDAGDADDDDESELQSIQKQMANLQKASPPTAPLTAEELIVSPIDFNSFCLFAVASVGLLISFYVRRARQSPVAPPLLGTTPLLG